MAAVAHPAGGCHLRLATQIAKEHNGEHNSSFNHECIVITISYSLPLSQMDRLYMHVYTSCTYILYLRSHVLYH